jgi:hypothetical protein
MCKLACSTHGIILLTAHLQNVIERKYWILLVSLEMCFQSPELKLLQDLTWAECFMYVIIDECHCVTQ